MLIKAGNEAVLYVTSAILHASKCERNQQSAGGDGKGESLSHSDANVKKKRSYREGYVHNQIYMALSACWEILIIPV